MRYKNKPVYKRVYGEYVIDIIELNNQIVKRKDGLLQFTYYNALNIRKYIYGRTVEEIAEQYRIILNAKN